MAGLWATLLDGGIQLTGNAYLFGVILLIFIVILAFLSNASKVLIVPLMLIFSYGLLLFGLIPMALFGGLLLLSALVFAITILNVMFGTG